MYTVIWSYLIIIDITEYELSKLDMVRIGTWWPLYLIWLCVQYDLPWLLVVTSRLTYILVFIICCCLPSVHLGTWRNKTVIVILLTVVLGLPSGLCVTVRMGGKVTMNGVMCVKSLSSPRLLGREFRARLTGTVKSVTCHAIYSWSSGLRHLMTVLKVVQNISWPEQRCLY